MTPPPPPHLPPLWHRYRSGVAAVEVPPTAFDRHLALESRSADMLPFRKPAGASLNKSRTAQLRLSFDGRSPNSKYWGVSTTLVKMCPHVKPGGGQCGLDADHCFCLCLLCQGPMNARKRCGRRLPDGTMCPWGQDRSPEVSSPEQDPPPPPRKRPACSLSPAASTALPAASAADVGTPERTSPSRSPSRSCSADPAAASATNVPNPRPPTTWTRTVTGEQKHANTDGK
jgi:hypothetical protein